MVLVRRSAQRFIGNVDVELIPSPCKGALESLVDNVKAELHIVSPYITEAGTALITNRVKTSTRRFSIAVQLLTDLDPLSVCQGSCDPQAILYLTRSFPRTKIIHLPRVHAKIMVADRAVAIIGSANLTEGGIQDNYEYCIKVSSPKIASKIAEDVEEYSSLGAPITANLLESYSEASISLRETFRRKEQAVSSSLKKEFHARVRSADDLLLRARVRVNEGVTGIFSRTILFLLRAGPMRTVDIHPQIKKIHPDLCDDSVDRIIDGERFGKKWKHLVRTAQQILKRNRLIEFDGRFWRIAGTRLA
ncbi:MAG: phospholipase D family protein [Candidatus Methylomirabilales bacterium]